MLQGGFQPAHPAGKNPECTKNGMGIQRSIPFFGFIRNNKNMQKFKKGKRDRSSSDGSISVYDDVKNSRYGLNRYRLFWIYSIAIYLGCSSIAFGTSFGMLRRRMPSENAALMSSWVSSLPT